jgi:hypothetical protein
VLPAALSLGAAAAVAIAISFRSAGVEHAPNEPVVSAASPSPIEPSPPPPPPEVPIETPSEPSEAERFYNATVAFEIGDYERSRAELEVLLERKPDFAAARELQARVERALAPKPAAVVEPPPPRRPEPKPPDPAPVREKEAPAPPPPTPAEILDAARVALLRSDIETARANLDRLDPTYPGASALREELSLRSWEKTLPLLVGVRHDHALGSCSGTLELTSKGYAFRSKEHQWAWSFAEVAKLERREGRRLRIETVKQTSYNFELREAVSEESWSRHRSLAAR